MTARKTPLSPLPEDTPAAADDALATTDADLAGFGSNLGGEDDVELPELNRVINAPRPAAPKNAKPTDRRIRIRLEDNDQIPPGGQFFSVNGRGYQIQANEEVNVPIAILSILDTAVESHPVTDGNGTVINYRNRLRFPYTVLGVLERMQAEAE